MKIFKNRGDFYISKSDIKGSQQAKILYSLLAVIVVFTVAFLVLLSQKYSSAADFFGRGEVTVTQESVKSEEALPAVSGKTNYLILETDDSGSKIHYIFLLQADKDNLSYKAAALSPDMKLDKTSIPEIFSQGGGAALQTKLAEYFGFEIDYYAQFEVSSFVDFASKLGKFVYFLPSDITFSGGKENDKYTIKLGEGEQNIDGKDISNLMRYFSLEKKDYEAENELILRTFTQLINPENYEDCESLFRLFVKSSVTDITMRDFENGRNPLEVFCKRNADITLYSEAAQYESNVLTKQSMNNIKGYFSYD